MHLPAQIFAESPVVPDVAEVGEDGSRRDQDATQQKPATAAIRVTAHKPKTNRNQKRCEGGQHRERRQFVAVDAAGPQNHPQGCTCRQERQCGDKDDARAGAVRQGRIRFPIADARALISALQSPPLPITMLAGAGRTGRCRSCGLRCSAIQNPPLPISILAGSGFRSSMYSSMVFSRMPLASRMNSIASRPAPWPPWCGVT